MQHYTDSVTVYTCSTHMCVTHSVVPFIVSIFHCLFDNKKDKEKREIDEFK